MQGYTISTDQDELDVELIYGFISTSYWATGIPRHTMAKAIENSLCFGVYAANGQQVGFARVVTDKATFAYLADVFIVDAHRGKGLSKWLVATIIAHPELQGLRRMMLGTVDAHGLYAPFGFSAIAEPERFMQIWQPNVYRTVLQDPSD